MEEEVVNRWISPFIVYRLNADGTLVEVFHAEDLKKAKYWLTYIAEPGDLLCRTPAHPRHSQQSEQPEYWSHKQQSGQPSTQRDDWFKFARSKTSTVEFPDEQHRLPSEGAEA